MWTHTQGAASLALGLLLVAPPGRQWQLISRRPYQPEIPATPQSSFGAGLFPTPSALAARFCQYKAWAIGIVFVNLYLLLLPYTKIMNTKRQIILAGVLCCAVWCSARTAASGAGTEAMPQTADSLAKQRPDHVNNAESPCFPAVFNQDGGSCGSASRIGYMFTHEINAFRGADARLPENVYPTHFTWLLTNSHSGKEGMAMANGVPNSVVYGGTTYSKVFGNQDCGQADFGWMQGYDKWYSAMFNRISHNSFSPYGLDTEQGREYVKHWIWNHNGDKDYHVGGIAGIGVASACRQAPIAADPEGRNEAAGVVGMKYVTRWGDGVDHALTIVGYDDRVVFDLDSNNVYGEKDKDECGAWIIVNSWGNGWANKGFIYCPYKYGFPVRQHEGGAWHPEFYHVRKNYRPLRTLRLRMAYGSRSELKLIVGVSSDLSATEPEATVEMEHFKYAGDGRSGQAKNGKEAYTPMLGKWADGTMHTEPMEFGYDLTDISAGFDTRRPLKYFFIIETLPTAFASGTLYDCSVLDYEFDRRGIETPLLTGPARTIRSGGHRTVVSAVVQGEPFFAPVNLRPAGGTRLAWDAPQPTHYARTSYILYRGDIPVDTLPPSAVSYDCPDARDSYSVAAMYSYPVGKDSTATALSARTSERRPMGRESIVFHAMDLENGGLVIPDVFRTHYDNATIEYWLKPRTWRSWNQACGAGWGHFLIHANDNGALTAGWDCDNRIDTEGGIITPGKWYHLAFVVSRDTLTVYVNGEETGTLVSKSRRGIGGFGNFSFSTDRSGSMDGELAEVRVWKEARSGRQINDMMNVRFEQAGIPSTMLAYYKGEMFSRDSTGCWRDFAGEHHARMQAYGTHREVPCDLAFDVPAEAGLDILCRDSVLYAGREFELQAIASPAIASVRWNVPDVGIRDMELSRVSLLFAVPGRHTVRLQGQTADGRNIEVERHLDVMPVKGSAAFLPIHRFARAGERISFHPVTPVPGGRYRWTMPGADTKVACTQSAAATYEVAGVYPVNMRVTDPLSGKTLRSTYRLTVRNVAPEVHFDLSARVVQKGTRVVLTDRSRFAPTGWQWRIDSRRDSLRLEGKRVEMVMDRPGVYDVTLTASNAEGSNVLTGKQMLIVCNADSRNGLNFGRDEASLTTVQPLWEGTTSEMTIDWWMNASTQDRTSGMGHSRGTWQMTANKHGRLTFSADSASVHSGNGFILPGSWHHYAVTFDGGRVCFLRDGELCHADTLRRNKQVVSSLPAAPSFGMGGKDRPMNAVVDELRVWKTALTDTALQARCNAPLADIPAAEREGMLVLYYSFDQNGGDVLDLTSRSNNGRRTSFGPDGDAWGLSMGVFCLSHDAWPKGK